MLPRHLFYGSLLKLITSRAQDHRRASFRAKSIISASCIFEPSFYIFHLLDTSILYYEAQTQFLPYLHSLGCVNRSGAHNNFLFLLFRVLLILIKYHSSFYKTAWIERQITCYALLFIAFEEHGPLLDIIITQGYLGESEPQQGDCFRSKWGLNSPWV